MSDSNARERLDAKHERNREQRIEGIKRWVEYIESNPPKRGDYSRTQSSTTSSMQPKASRLRLLTSSTSQT
jgi:hypothetical protein